ncbi:hypothetical protein KDI_38310 [Dictyobacter arantiisoli]|uniref:MobA-like NTP transferase domain-containing protein n=2 Tax=Dictyobacter arantiisoli TaxID=2014874 RepID=A0A5A5TFX8_9CHLR|nr:hypothetical protein KDI_38310 [Dictyobacter arantiisoli]
MGRDKAFLPLPGVHPTTFSARLATLLLTTCQEVLLVARDAEQAEQCSLSLPSSLRTTVRVITDRVVQIGPLMGLYSGLSAMHASQALVTAVDTPFLQPALLNFLLEQSRVHPEQLLVPIVEDIPQVLLAIYPRHILPILEARLAEGRRDPRALLQGTSVIKIPEAQLRIFDPQLRSFINLNTPEDFSSYIHD